MEKPKTQFKKGDKVRCEWELDSPFRPGEVLYVHENGLLDIRWPDVPCITTNCKSNNLVKVN